MPREPFRHPEDAHEQLARAVAFHEQQFGMRPIGVWPSEGSVSDAMVPLVARAGFKWMATDEAILARTTGRPITRDGHGNVEQPELLYRSYRVGAGETVNCGFRDHTLSDLIGFTYAGWSAEFAADDFLHRLVEAGRRYGRRGGGEATVFVILDGENAWEYYEGQGRPFLRALYQRLESHPEIRTVTMAEACAGAHEALPSIFPGSWINGDFYIWIGHRDDHRAWSQLVDARHALDSPRSDLSPEALARAREEMLIAEGSDWFWWYGDDHSSSHDLEFDELFRRHVRNIYRALEVPVPEELFVTNISTQPTEVAIQQPTGFIQPEIDGEVTSYFEWVGAGCVDGASAAGAMHQVSDRAPGLSLVEFGFDLENLYLRIDGTRPMASVLASGMTVSVRFLKPSGVRVNVKLVSEWGQTGVGVGSDPGVVWFERRTGDGSWRRESCPGLAASTKTITELRIPFGALGVRALDTVAFVVVLTQDTREVEHHPRHQPIEVEVPDQRFVARNWTA